MEAHADALEYDLMTMTGRTLSEYESMGARGYGALAHFVERVPIDSELWREMHGDAEYPRVWSSSLKQSELLADVVDMLALVAHLTAQSHSKRRLKRSKPMQRPWVKDSTRRIGRGAIPAAEFDAWWQSKAKERTRRAASGAGQSPQRNSTRGGKARLKRGGADARRRRGRQGVGDDHPDHAGRTRRGREGRRPGSVERG